MVGFVYTLQWPVLTNIFGSNRLIFFFDRNELDSSWWQTPSLGPLSGSRVRMIYLVPGIVTQRPADEL